MLGPEDFGWIMTPGFPDNVTNSTQVKLSLLHLIVINQELQHSLKRSSRNQIVKLTLTNKDDALKIWKNIISEPDS